MTENNANNDTSKYLFINLVTMLSMSAMQQLGKLKPEAGKAEVNLDATQATIDTLDMLAAKTKGNLDKDETRLITDTLSMLKMNFVETKDEEQRKKPAPDATHSVAGGAQNGKVNPPPAAPQATRDTSDPAKNTQASPAETTPASGKTMPSQAPDDGKAQSDGKKQPESEPQAQEKPEPEPGSKQANDPKFHKSYD